MIELENIEKLSEKYSTSPVDFIRQRTQNDYILLQELKKLMEKSL